MEINAFQLPTEFPIELWEIIWDDLEPHSKATCRAVCISWMQLLDKPLEADLRKTPDKWKFYLVNVRHILLFDAPTLNWLNKRSRIIQNHIADLLQFKGTANFVLWVLQNFKLTTSQYLNLIESHSNERASLAIIKFLFENIKEFKLGPDYFSSACDVLNAILDDNKPTFIHTRATPELFEVANYLTQKINASSFVRDLGYKMVLAACVSNDVKGLRKYEKSAKTMKGNTFATAIFLATKQQNADILRELVIICPSQWASMRKLGLAVLGSFIATASVLEWVITQTTNAQDRIKIYTQAFKNFCTAKVINLEADIAILKRVKALVGDVSLSIDSVKFDNSSFSKKLLSSLGKWMCENHTFHYGQPQTTVVVGNFGIMGAENLFNRGMASLNLAKTLLKLPPVSDLWFDYLKTNVNAQVAFYLWASKKVISHFWETGFIYRARLMDSDFAARIISKSTSVKRVTWLYLGVSCVKIRPTDWRDLVDNYEQCRSWKVLKYAFDSGMMNSYWTESMVRVFKSACRDTDIECLEWCYNKFNFVKTITLTAYSKAARPWIETRLEKWQWEKAKVTQIAPPIDV